MTSGVGRYVARSNVTPNCWLKKRRKDCIVCRFNLPMSKRIDARDATLIYYLAGRKVNFFMFAVFFNLTPLLFISFGSTDSDNRHISNNTDFKRWKSGLGVSPRSDKPI